MQRAIAMVLLLVLAFSLTTYAKDLRVGYVDDIGFAPLVVAEAKGYWKEQGLKVDLVPFEDSAVQAKALESGEIDIAGDLMGNFVGLEMAGSPIKLAAETHWSNGSVKLLTKAGQDPKQLKGAMVGIGDKQTAQLFMLSRFLNSNGIRLSDVKVGELPPDRLVASFVKGQMPVVVLQDPYSIQAVHDGNGTIAVDSSRYQGLITEGFAVSNTALASIPEEQWIKFYRGWIKSVIWLRGMNFKWGDLRELINTKNFKAIAAQPDATIVDLYNGVRFHAVYEAIKRHGELGGLEYHVRDVLYFMRDNALVKTIPEPRTLIQSDAFEKALKTLK